MAYKDRLTIGDLVVVDYLTDFESPAQRDWKQRNLGSRVPAAEKCARQVFYMSQAQREGFPDPKPHEQFYIREGQEAYAFLLRFMLGFGNSKGMYSYDAPAGERFFRYWGGMNRRNQRAASFYEPLVRSLTQDCSAIIKSTGIEDIQAPIAWLIARDFSQQRKGEAALIIGDTSIGKDEQPRMTQLTERMAVTLNDNRMNRVGTLDFTHPDTEELQRIGNGISKLYRQKEIEIDLKPFDFDRDLALAIECADSVYITMDMDKFPEADQLIIDSWRNRQRRDNTLVHLKAPPGNQAISSDPWLQAGLDNYFSPEDLREESAARREYYEQTAKAACAATEHCAAIRANRRTPRVEVLKPRLLELDLVA